jgi:hypothetical protein
MRITARREKGSSSVGEVAMLLHCTPTPSSSNVNKYVFPMAKPIFDNKH